MEKHLYMFIAVVIGTIVALALSGVLSPVAGNNGVL